MIDSSAESGRSATKPIEMLTGEFNVALSLPGSKSITLRDAVLASLAQGQSVLEFPADCDDFSRISQALIQLGVAMSRGADGSVVDSGYGRPLLFRARSSRCRIERYSGSVPIRLALLRRDETTVDGLLPLRARPNKHLIDAVAYLGASVQSTDDGCLPVSIRGPDVFKRTIRVRGDRSSQYLSALLLVGPLMPEGLELDVDGSLCAGLTSTSLYAKCSASA